MRTHARSCGFEIPRTAHTITNLHVASDGQLSSLHVHHHASGRGILALFTLFHTCSFQAARWVAVKEASAGNIMSIVADYMLAQRVKKELFDNSADYLAALEVHHTVLQAAMKTKQVVDVAACDALDHAIEDVGKMYTK